MALFPRVKVWTTKEVLTYSDLNAEFDNILNNMAAATTVGYSATVAQMRTQTNPGGVGSESLAVSISGELERIRFVIARITGKTYWYETPSRSLASSTAKPRHMFCPTSSSGDDSIQGLLPESIRAGIYSTAMDGADYTANAKFSSAALYNLNAIPRYFKLDPGRLSAGSATYSFWFQGFSANDTLLYNGSIGLRLYVNGSGLLQADITKPTTTGSNKQVVSVVGTTSVAGSSTYRHVLIAYKLTNSSSDTLQVFLDGVQMGTPITGTAIHGNVPTKNDTLVLCGNQVGTIGIGANMNVVPDSAGWAKTTTGGSAAVSNGVLTATNATGTTQYWSISPINTGAGTSNFVQFKIRIKSYNSVTTVYSSQQDEAFGLVLRNATQGMRLTMSANQITLSTSNGVNFGGNGAARSVNHNFMDWTVVTMNMDSTTTSVYVNQTLAFFTSTQNDATGASLAFGKLLNGSTSSIYEMEYIYSGAGAINVTANSTTSQSISDFCAFEGAVTDSTIISSLQVSSPLAIFGQEQGARITWPSNQSAFSPATTAVIAGTTATAGNSGIFYSDGRTPLTINVSYDLYTATTAGSVTASIYIEATGAPAGFLDFTNANSAVFNVPSTGFGVFPGAVDGVLATRLIYLTGKVVGTALPLSGIVSYSGVFPAGAFTATAKLYNHTGSIDVLVLRTDFTVSQG